NRCGAVCLRHRSQCAKSGGPLCSVPNEYSGGRFRLQLVIFSLAHIGIDVAYRGPLPLLPGLTECARPIWIDRLMQIEIISFDWMLAKTALKSPPAAEPRMIMIQGWAVRH